MSICSASRCSCSSSAGGLRRSRLGLALLVIGEDETVARQVGINVPFAKVTIFVVSAMFITMTGALMAPRFGFINPNFAFNPLVSFQVVIMAFLGGLQRLWGPVLGVVPLIILSEGLQTEFPFWFSILLGLVFMVIVYFLPRGVTGLLEDGWAALGRPLEWPRGLDRAADRRLGVAVAAGGPPARHRRRHRGHLGQNRAARERETLTRWPRCCRSRV